jgi:hypothetical protein
VNSEQEVLGIEAFESALREFMQKLLLEFYDVNNFPTNGTGLKANRIINKLAGDRLI